MNKLLPGILGAHAGTMSTTSRQPFGHKLIGFHFCGGQLVDFGAPARSRWIVRKLNLSQNRSRGPVFKLQITIDLNRSATKSSYLLAVSFAKANSIDM